MTLVDDGAPPRTGLSTRAQVALATAAGLIVWIPGVWRPAPWRDEIVTVAISRRSYGEILDLAGTVDAVLTGFYLLVHTLSPGTLTGIRLLSVAAMAGALGLTVWLGRALQVPRAGPWAVGVLLASATATRYAQEARPYALTALVATAATGLLVRALRERSAAPWIPYAAAVAVLGYTELVALLIVGAHAVTVVVSGRHCLARFAVAAAAAGVAVTPVVWLGAGQRAAIAWIPDPDVGRLLRSPEWFAGSPLTLAGAVAALALAAAFPGRRPPSPGPSVLTVAVPWAVLPPLLLFAAGQVTSIYGERYLFFCLPGAALVVGSALARLPWLLATTCLLVMVLGGLSRWELRTAAGHGEDLHALRLVVAHQARPGDGLLFEPPNTRMMAEAYPSTFGRLDDVTLGRSGAESGTLAGTGPDEPDQVVPTRIRMHDRVWVIRNERVVTDDVPSRLASRVLEAEYRLDSSARIGTFYIELHTRR